MNRKLTFFIFLGDLLQKLGNYFKYVSGHSAPAVFKIQKSKFERLMWECLFLEILKLLDVDSVLVQNRNKFQLLELT